MFLTINSFRRFHPDNIVFMLCMEWCSGTGVCKVGWTSQHTDHNKLNDDTAGRVAPGGAAAASHRLC